VQLQTDGRGVQAGRLRDRYGEHAESGAAKVVRVLLQALSDGRQRNGLGEALELQLRGVGDHPFVMKGGPLCEGTAGSFCAPKSEDNVLCVTSTGQGN
jgi:hypothetical protein